MTNKIFLFPLSLAVIFFASMIIIFSPLKSVKVFNVSLPDPVIVSSPNLSQSIKSPVTISGKIDRSWVFEGSFPVELLDSNGKSIFKGNATVPNWTETLDKYADFSLDLKYTTKLSTGTLIIKNDNPSGLPENDKSYKIPITFKR
ncbi:MAG: hypothetical protein US68_C0010G0095 [Candidatus Shapirobacteria bacterium GW2011_GWE1_38_10]|uniref:Bacterial spore germination immunoglobulin-like domain-containing protein n=1 Tax=Candidatus Shapirobacteria bacterium GW2011_GWE1_38_10 TaxID=1618488 RepID=A0A0G0LBA3_9BACT|nr:MAG: hypothetical protein US46_C0006G0156 [Candidatus Shapirobacteria bacterium GW2011_GWF2_37_20]KKQ49961.1 MAG: hypothetical protein US68_C0010G0095 [Candidatus Shapirobacteria bacterium GW2011_GWE1_38_10]KKQ63959.1 MAG: hypothetical protein US85_C0013G0033 [Candidatus Shapirobacteria bacterium GW2011_GWF1_38_23]HBP51496.1 hypothetical protein [Candidatus Shapirobacteria bacterium]